MSSKSIATSGQGILPLDLPGLSAQAENEVSVRPKLPVDATRLLEALKYQVHVAIDYCHTLQPDDVLWIEVFGDVTVEGREQVEVKDYSGDLTDNHENLWKTLKNWLNEDFPHQDYASLVLLTTQEFGARASIQNWEGLDLDQRLEALEKIHKDAEKRYADRSTSRDGDSAVMSESKAKARKGKQEHIPEVLKFQRLVMAPGMREALKQVLAKVKLITDQPDLLGLIDQYKRRYLRAVLSHRQDEFLDDLFGFMTNAMKMTEGWSFTSAQFSSKIAELTKRYMVGTVKFPRIDAGKLGLEAQEASMRERLYVRKLEEIGADKRTIGQATVDRLSADKYIAELYKDCATSREDVEEYSSSHLQLHCSSRLSWIDRSPPLPSHSERQRNSRAFYHETCARPVVVFGSYDFTPVAFRNGVYHMLADQDSGDSLNDFQWKLWE
ncbi:hypothetical protein [Xanthomonas hortorum]|uniref:hypothetical protein n=1 Tax=Xanthomonas hortorum TaxID=56454 RepID=UPI001F4506B8|nr:hypothetical protein [Xanthomonas hortorum]MCE4299882.1 hypothetical protein [Xanthomonas hortorum pv. vitians]MCE4368740.1 hypothetical protein [Xanthomonas hortorum pv. vitians]